jgi:hypothetical protein
MPENCSRMLSRLTDNLTRKSSKSIIGNYVVTKHANTGVWGSIEEMESYVVILFVGERLFKECENNLQTYTRR